MTFIKLIYHCERVAISVLLFNIVIKYHYYPIYFWFKKLLQFVNEERDLIIILTKGNTELMTKLLF
ncbi:hypothetical protein FHS59_001432 [Algoriphagus iocasae]|uniref:Uncharacterized protein n=1 Tax=Algoriphagus iocasae TaxID=1836499 RepID=A0A841MK16_9BACT|nr:hypothetical protein [Algoriphagus iocasae]